MTTGFRSLCGAMALILAGCGGGGGTPATPEPAATLTLAGSSSEVLAGGKVVALTATPSANAGALSWTLGAGSPGSLSATTGASVNYLPPPASAVKSNTPVTITASGTGISKSFTLTLYPDPGPAALSLIAGTPGGAAFIDGTGSEARFNQIGDVASDAAGNLLVTDHHPASLGPLDLRTVSPSGKVTSSFITSDIAPREAGNANDPFSITVGPDGAVYFLYKGRVRRQDGPEHAVTVAPNNPARRVVADRAGNLYLMETDLISKVTPQGVVSTFAGSRDGINHSVDGQGTDARFGSLSGITVDKAGNLYAIDGFAIRKITPGAEVTTLAGAYDPVAQPHVDGTGGAASFGGPQGIAVAPDGAVLVLDGTDERLVPPAPYERNSFIIYSLRRVNANGVVTTIKTGLTRVNSVRVDALGRVLLIGPQQINLLAANGDVTAFAGMQDDTVQDLDGGIGKSRLVEPQSIAVDAAGNLFVIEADHRDLVSGQQETGLHLRKIAPDGTVSTLSSRDSWWGKAGAAGPAISKAAGIAIDRQGNLYIGDAMATGSHGFNQWGGSIVKVAPDGSFSVFAGKHEISAPGGSADGAGEAARFADPSVTGFDADGNLYIDDRGSIRKITPERVVSTVSALPVGFGADPDGTQYRMDGNTLVRVAPNGATTVLAGQTAGIKLGSLPASFYSGAFVRTGPRTFAIVSGSAVLKLVTP